MKNKLELDALRIRSFKTSDRKELRGGGNTVYYTCIAGCTHGPDCIDPGTGGGSNPLPCEE